MVSWAQMLRNRPTAPLNLIVYFPDFCPDIGCLKISRKKKMKERKKGRKVGRKELGKITGNHALLSAS